MKRTPLLLYAALLLPLWAQQPLLQIRLLDPVSSTGLSGASIRAVVLEAEGTGVPQGSIVHGHTDGGKPQRDRLKLLFDRITIGSRRDYPVQARILAVDNAREAIDKDGTILALDPLHKRPGKIELLLLAAAHAHPMTLAFLEGTKFTLRELEKPSVHYAAGTDMTLRFETTPPTPTAAPGTVVPAVLVPALAQVLAALPLRTETYATRTPSDWTNLAFIGTREAVQQAFEAAGWSTAAALSLRADFKVFAAVAEHHAYTHAPVSRLAINGHLPDMVYQKQTNTFAKRHHIRIWKTEQNWQGKPVWIAAATHDIGIDFSPATKTFTHRIDGNVDRERHKVALDLQYAQPKVKLYAQDRPLVPKESANATGDSTHTDGRLYALLFE
ncbi:hypothetical protein F183_A14690 [Bryobacterales bacterium F-183]|nr:hypothetical protein F183_A14690 [Bryobacterales bacterium F-183]